MGPAGPRKQLSWRLRFSRPPSLGAWTSQRPPDLLDGTPGRQRRRVGPTIICPAACLTEPGADLLAADASAVDDLRPVRNSWWFAYNRFSSGAKCVYADIYDLPPDLGRFDVAVFGSILLHLSRPFDALREAAKVTEQAIIVSEPVPDIPLSRRPLASFDPSGRPYVFWGLSPPAFAGMLRRLGFPYLSVTSHWQHRVDAAQKEKAYFTIVARRRGPVGRNYEGPSLTEIIRSRVGRLISMMRRSIRSR